MRVLVIGSGGREHALCWKIAQSPRCEKLYCAPGSSGISESAECVNINAENIDALLKFACENKIDLTVVGPEGPLVKGITDAFQKKGLRIFGPSKELAAIEGSKVFAKELMKRLGVPTADFRVFTRFDDALQYITDMKKPPLVVKADGLAAGKGVVVCGTFEEAKNALKTIMIDRAFGSAGDRVIIEDCLVGEEASIIAITDGVTIIPLASSQDHKRVFNGDRGPNTGGMGVYSPAPVITDLLFKKILDDIIYKVVRGLSEEGKVYRGALYAGIMVTKDGPFVLEFNARFGDPETQAILPRLKGDFLDALDKASSGDLKNCRMEWDNRPCVSVVIASGGYPGDYEKGVEIRGIDELKGFKDVVVFHAGTKLGSRSTDSRRLFITSGGRVLNVTALGNDMREAIETAYTAVRKVSFDKMHFRTDIGFRALNKR